MSRILPDIAQNGYVVEDLDRALDHWVNVLHVGPWFRLDHLPLDYYTYLGQESEPDLSVAVANWGSTQIELIQQFNEAPSPYRDQLLTRGPGLNHVCTLSDRFDELLNELHERGQEPDVRGVVTGIGGFAYFNTNTKEGVALEIGDSSSEAVRGFFDTVSQAARDWDGSDPVRLMQ